MIDFDVQLKGETSSHRFDAILSGKRQLTLVKYFDESKETGVEDIVELRDTLLDVYAAQKVRRIRLIIIGHQFASDVLTFFNGLDNWTVGNCRVFRSLIQMNREGYRVISTSFHESDYEGLPSYAPTSIENDHAANMMGRPPSRWKTITAIVIVVMVLISTFSIYLIANSSNNGSGGGMTLIHMSLKENITGNWTIIVSADGDQKINDTYVRVYHGSYNYQAPENLDNRTMFLQPFRLSLLTPGAYHQGISFYHSANPHFYDDMPWVNRSILHEGDFFNSGNDYFTLNSTMYPGVLTFALYTDTNFMMGSISFSG